MVQITNAQAAEARQALAGMSKLIWPGAVALRIKRVYREVNTAWEDMDALRQEALERLGKKGADGRLATNEQGMVSFETPEAEREFHAYLREIYKATVEIRHALAEADVCNKEIAPELLIGLGPLLIEEDDDEPNAAPTE